MSYEDLKTAMIEILVDEDAADKDAEAKRIFKEILDNGADSGYPGFTTYSETGKFYDEWEKDIWELLGEEADDAGENTLEMIAEFEGAENVGDSKTFENLLVWAALETVAAREAEE